LNTTTNYIISAKTTVLKHNRQRLSALSNSAVFTTIKHDA